MLQEEDGLVKLPTQSFAFVKVMIFKTKIQGQEGTGTKVL
jgi:hypothetical protein